jgi:hypothetical protein
MSYFIQRKLWQDSYVLDKIRHSGNFIRATFWYTAKPACSVIQRDLTFFCQTHFFWYIANFMGYDLMCAIQSWLASLLPTSQEGICLRWECPSLWFHLLPTVWWWTWWPTKGLNMYFRSSYSLVFSDIYKLMFCREEAWGMNAHKSSWHLVSLEPKSFGLGLVLLTLLLICCHIPIPLSTKSFLVPYFCS